MQCPSHKENDAGLCYTKCRDGYDGIGPVCWGKVPDGWVSCGMGAAKNKYECEDAVGAQVMSVGEFALFVGTAGASSAGTTAVKAAKIGSASSKWAKMRSYVKKMMDNHPRLKQAVESGWWASHYGFTALDIYNEDGVTDEDAVRLLATCVSLFDPTGVASVIEAYTWPKCSKLLEDYPAPVDVPQVWVPSTDLFMDATFDPFYSWSDRLDIGS